MAKIGDTPAASRYEGLATGPNVIYTFEVQPGLPVDASNASLRNLSPFTIRILPPDVLFSTAALVEAEINTGVSGVGAGASDAFAAAQRRSVDLITQASRAADGNALADDLANALSTVTLVDVDTSTLQRYVSEGTFLTNQSSEYTSTIVDLATAADIALQLQYILAAPPLTLLINPTDMNINHTKIQSYATRTRYGYIFESWGEEQVKLTFSGSTGGFMAGVGISAGSVSAADGQTSSVSGLQYAAKRDSAAWQNFISLYTFYRNNGYIYDTIGSSEAHHLIGALAIDYDQWTYVGSIDSFNYSYDEGSPHRVTFDIDFTVSRMYDWATAPSVVLPMNSPTVSPGNVGSAGTSQATGSRLAGSAEEASDVAQVPLDLFGTFS